MQMHLSSGDRQMPSPLRLISHPLCPYVQRAAIALVEKDVPFERIDIDLASKPAWFLALSPLGRVPVLQVEGQALFESAAILDYLDDTRPPRLHPADPLRRADHRAWIAFGSAVLDGIAGLYGAPDQAVFGTRRERLVVLLGQVEERLVAAPWFDGPDFSLVDAAFAPIFRYLDVFDRLLDHGLLDHRPKLDRWRRALASRPSVEAAVAHDYKERLMTFLAARSTYLGERARQLCRQAA
jgi:glutathione S-transferase